MNGGSRPSCNATSIGKVWLPLLEASAVHCRPAVFPYVQQIPPSLLIAVEDRFHFIAYRAALDLPSPTIYERYCRLREAGDSGELQRFVGEVRELDRLLFQQGSQPHAMSMSPIYEALIKARYPDHGGYGSYRESEGCLDRSEDLELFEVRPVYSIDLAQAKRVNLRAGAEADVSLRQRLEALVERARDRFKASGGDPQNACDAVRGKVVQWAPTEPLPADATHAIYAAGCAVLAGQLQRSRLKELVLDLHFSQQPAIEQYLRATSDRVAESISRDYYHLLELREFFADRLPDTLRAIVPEAESNALRRLLPWWYQQMSAQQAIALEEGKFGLTPGLLRRLAEIDGNPGLTAEERMEIRTRILAAERCRVARALDRRAGVKVDPDEIDLERLNLQDLLARHQEVVAERLPERLQGYLQGLFADEVSMIDAEIAKYEAVKGRISTANRLEVYITKNHTAHHALRTAGVCVAEDVADPSNPYSESLWNLENFFIGVLRDPAGGRCEGALLLHYYEEQGQRILTAAFDPCSTYLHKVDQEELFNGVLGVLVEFADENDIDVIACSKKLGIRTNRTGGEFEAALQARVEAVGEKLSLNQPVPFSFDPPYQQQDLDVLWRRSR